MTSLVLASTSPYRRELLERLGMPFTTAAPEVNEGALPGESPQHLVARLAEHKARAVAASHPDSLIIGSDQVAVLDDHILGKPGNHDDAVRQLTLASGRTVNFFTGICLLNTHTDHAQVEVVGFAVHFRPLTPTQIKNYLNKETPYNCAGSFKSEGLGTCLFERLEGDDPTALVGLPLITLVRMLEQEGFSPI